VDERLADRRGELQRAWRARIGGGRGSVTAVARPDVASSWERSAVSVDPDLRAAPVAAPEHVTARWAESPLGRASRIVVDDLRDLAADGDLMAAITDETVTIAWAAGGRRMTRKANRVHFTLGGCWAEGAVGTNALALAADSGRPATVFSAEHFAPMVHDWVCYSAPIVDPVSGRVLGVIDLSTVWDRAHPALLTTVGALARCVEHELAALAGPAGTGGVVGPGLELCTLGPPAVRVDGAAVTATRRQLELLTVLSLHPDGLTLDELTGRVYGDRPVSPSTVKAELSHLRAQLGGRIGSRPYRLVGPVVADHRRLLDALGRGDVATAAALYRGPMLTVSDSPDIEQWRHHIDVSLRDAVLASGRADLLYLLSGCADDDADVHRATLAALAPGDPRRSIVAGRLAATDA
jgi:hypothetical protein